MPEPSPQYRAQCIEELQHLLDQPSAQESRPCPQCDRLCLRHESSTCTCSCTSDCSWAPLEMSSDSERYPVEPGIVPMVFSLNTLRVCMPCWSCEGHFKDNGFELSKVPKVWFYARSQLYPRMISEYLTQLNFRRKLNYDWNICLTFSESRFEPAYSIEPKVTSLETLKLDLLQKDSRVIGENLREGIFELAKEYLDHFKK